jgi:hypothetical protein
MLAHTAEVLRQVKGAGVQAGGWTGGDAWFGSVMSCVELYKRLNVYSTFIVKNNRMFFPMVALNAVLKARHNKRPAGHWVVMRTTIADVPLMAIAYAWSQKGISYFITTCGATEPDPVKYVLKFEDEWGHVGSRLLDRLMIVHFLYEYLPLIDEHNKQRQNLLALEKRWPTRDFWYRLLTTLLGMAVVDFHRCYRYNSIKVDGQQVKEVDSIVIAHFTDLMCGNLEYWQYKRHHNIMEQKEESLTRIIDDKTGKEYREPTELEIKKGRTKGAPIKYSCFICRRYLDENDQPYRRSTAFWCKHCHMPLCQTSRKGDDGGYDNGRLYDCVEEHHCTDDNDFSCSDLHHKGTNVPPAKYVQLHHRRRTRSYKLNC